MLFNHWLERYWLSVHLCCQGLQLDPKLALNRHRDRVWNSAYHQRDPGTHQGMRHRGRQRGHWAAGQAHRGLLRGKAPLPPPTQSCQNNTPLTHTFKCPNKRLFCRYRTISIISNQGKDNKQVLLVKYFFMVESGPIYRLS